MRIPLTQHWDLLDDYLRPERLKATLLAVLLFSSIGLQLLNPQIMRSFIDSALGGTALNHLIQLAGLYIVVAIVNQGLTVGATYLGQDVGWSATNRLREQLARHCLGLDLAFYHERTPGELIERIDGDVTALSTSRPSAPSGSACSKQITDEATSPAGSHRADAWRSGEPITSSCSKLAESTPRECWTTCWKRPRRCVTSGTATSASPTV